MESEHQYTLSRAYCHVLELEIECPFVKRNPTGPSTKCAFFEQGLQEIAKRDGKRWVQRLPMCKDWNGHLAVTMIPG